MNISPKTWFSQKTPPRSGLAENTRAADVPRNDPQGSQQRALPRTMSQHRTQSKRIPVGRNVQPNLMNSQLG